MKRSVKFFHVFRDNYYSYPADTFSRTKDGKGTRKSKNSRGGSSVAVYLMSPVYNKKSDPIENH